MLKHFVLLLRIDIFYISIPEIQRKPQDFGKMVFLLFTHIFHWLMFPDDGVELLFKMVFKLISGKSLSIGVEFELVRIFYVISDVCWVVFITKFRSWFIFCMWSEFDCKASATVLCNSCAYSNLANRSPITRHFSVACWLFIRRVCYVIWILCL